MSDLIAQASKDQLPALKQAEGIDLLLAADEASYFPYISFLQKMSKLCDPPHEMKAGTFALTEEKEPTNLGDEIDVQLLSARPFAWKYNATSNRRCYDPADPFFAHVQERDALGKEKREAEGDDSKYSWGVEYLLYLPKEQKCVTFAATSKSARRSAKKWHGKVAERALITWKSKFIDPENSDYSWHVIETHDCNTGDQYPTPDINMIGEAIDNFQNPEVEESVEEATEGSEEQ